MCSDTDVSEEHVASIFSFEMCSFRNRLLHRQVTRRVVMRHQSGKERSPVKATGKKCKKEKQP
jgi:hypothetical protein